jgi:putative transposase
MITRRERYETDLTDAELLLIEPLIPVAKSGGRPRDTEMREVLNAIFYQVRSGCAWRLLPHDFPVWPTVYGYFRTWRQDGIWQAMNDALRLAVREQEGRAADATAAIVDSQTVKTTEAAVAERGFDGAKLTTGRKRFILVDILGLLLTVFVTKGSVPERAGAQQMLEQTPQAILDKLRLLWADGGFSGPDFEAWVYEHCGCLVEIVKRSDDQKGFVVLPRRWIVERTFAWFSRFRRLSKDYERLAETSEAWIYTAMIRLMLKRLANHPVIYC